MTIILTKMMIMMANIRPPVSSESWTRSLTVVWPILAVISEILLNRPIIQHRAYYNLTDLLILFNQI